MKSILRFSSALPLAALVGCSQNQQPTAPETASLAEEASLSSLEKSLPKITVPDDYATIQAAVDAAVGAMKINVKSGTYTEAVNVNKPGLVIGATGTVTLNGNFSLTADADNVTIRNFKIFPPAGVYGINALGVTGGKAEDNTVTGGSVFEAGIVYQSSTGCTIKGNTLSGCDFGIVFSSSSGNTIDENSVNNCGAGIVLQTDSDNNKVSGNTVSASASTGLQLVFGSDLNSVKDNVCNGNGQYGIFLDEANNNTIGSGNTANANGVNGIYLSATANNNTVKKNTASGNTACDITNLAGNSGNVFIKNSAGCTSGF